MLKIPTITLLLIYASIPISGCTVKPQGRAEIENYSAPLPSKTTPSNTGVINTTILDDSGAEPSTSLLTTTFLSLRELLVQVFKRNASLEAMRKIYAASLERELQVSAFDDPMLSYSSVPSSINSTAVDYAQKITISQKIPWPGKLGLKGEISKQLAQSTNQDFGALKNQVAEAVKNAFYDYYYVTRAIEINDENLEIIKQFKSVAEVKYSAGTSSKQDALQAEVRLHHLNHKSIALKRALSVVASRINTLLNMPADTVLPSPPKRLAKPIPIEDFQTYLETAKEKHPELVSLTAQINAQESSVKLAEKDFMPDFTLEAGYNSLWQEDDLRPVIGIGINIPLQLERRRAKKREETSLFSSLKAKYVSKSSEIENDIKTAVDKINEAHHVVSLYRSKLLPASKENLAAARSEYEAGNGDYLRFLTAEESYLLARLESERAISSYHQHVAHLVKAIGQESLHVERGDLRGEKQ